MAPLYVYRETTWRSDDGSRVQTSLAVLSEAWEPLWERFTAVGPFDDADRELAMLYLAWFDYRRSLRPRH